MGSGYASGNSSLNYFFPDFVFQKNVLENIASSEVPESRNPVSTFSPSDWGTIKFVDFTNGNYALASSSPYKKAGTNDKDIGADIAGLNAATTSVIH
jgi:hypothetical protein